MLDYAYITHSLRTYTWKEIYVPNYRKIMIQSTHTVMSFNSIVHQVPKHKCQKKKK